MFVPNSAGAFGSASRLIAMRASTNNFQRKEDTAYIDIKKKHTKQVNRPSEPCTDETDNVKITACIAYFIQNQLGCTANFLGINGTMSIAKPLCQSSADLKKFASISAKLQFADESTIYDMTGCLSSCRKDKFEIKMTDKTEAIYPSTSYYGHVTLWLFISMHDTSYVQEEQYIIYDFNSFIADVGGYMGLLLGSSILSLYDEVERLFRSMSKRL